MKVYYYAIIRFNYNNKSKSYEGVLFDCSLDVNKVYNNYFKNYVYFNVINSTENEFSYNNNYPKLFYLVGFQYKPNKNLNFDVIFKKLPKYCIYVDLKNKSYKGYLGNQIHKYIYQDLNNIELFSNINFLQSLANDYKFNINHITNLSMEEYLDERKIKNQWMCYTYYENKEDVIARLILGLIEFK
jgi:hypothetical protein